MEKKPYDRLSISVLQLEQQKKDKEWSSTKRKTPSASVVAFWWWWLMLSSFRESRRLPFTQTANQTAWDGCR